MVTPLEIMQSLVNEGFADNVDEAAAQLEDMGIDPYDAEEMRREVSF
jgi:hypothetical protein